jgi:hypothetical protein
MQQLAYCPDHDYLLVLSNGTSNESTWQQEISTPMPGEANIATDYLTDNTLIRFSILVTNSDFEMYTETTGKDICKCRHTKICACA